MRSPCPPKPRKIRCTSNIIIGSRTQGKPKEREKTMSSGYSESHYWVSGVTRVCVIALLVVATLVVGFQLPQHYDSDEVKLERIKNERLEVFMQKLNMMDDEMARNVLTSIESIGKALDTEIKDEEEVKE
jgi:hypothetical protein